jgi:rhodanese-related sulfurtransferase
MQMFQTAIREALLILAAAVLLALTYTGITQKGLFSRPEPESTSSESEAPSGPETISIEEAEDLFTSGRAVFIDTRDEFSYREGHIRGAIHVSREDLPLRIESLRALAAEKILVPYCNGSGCHSSMEFGDRLFAAGISQVKIFYGGWEEWTASQLPTEKSVP